MSIIEDKVITKADQLDLFKVNNIDKTNSKKDIESLSWTDNIVSIGRPTKKTNNNVLWIRPEDSLFTLFNRAAKFVQDQKKWSKEDYADVIRNALPYLDIPLSSNFLDFAKLNSRFLTGDEKEKFLEDIHSQHVRRVFEVPSDVIGKFYIVLKSNNHNDINHEGMFARTYGKKVVFLNADSIIGKMNIWQDFSNYFQSKVNALNEAPIEDFTILIRVIKDMLIKGLICGTFANAHHNYSVLKAAADALPAKHTKEYLDLNNWTSVVKTQGYAYKLLSKFIVTQYSPHAVKSKEPKNADYRSFASSILYVLNSTEDVYFGK